MKAAKRKTSKKQKTESAVRADDILAPNVRGKRKRKYGAKRGSDESSFDKNSTTRSEKSAKISDKQRERMRLLYNDFVDIGQPNIERLQKLGSFPGVGSEFNSASLSKTVGNSLEIARKKRGMTIAEVAEAIGTSRAAVTRMEKGEQNQGIETIQRYADVLGFQIDLVFTPKEDSPKRTYRRVDELPDPGRPSGAAVNRTKITKKVRMDDGFLQQIDDVVDGGNRSQWLSNQFEKYLKDYPDTRPQSFASEKANKMVNIAISRKLDERIQKAAEQAGINPTQWMLRVAKLSLMTANLQNQKNQDPEI